MPLSHGTRPCLHPAPCAASHSIFRVTDLISWIIFQAGHRWWIKLQTWALGWDVKGWPFAWYEKGMDAVDLAALMLLLRGLGEWIHESPPGFCAHWMQKNSTAITYYQDVTLESPRFLQWIVILLLMSFRYLLVLHTGSSATAMHCCQSSQTLPDCHIWIRLKSAELMSDDKSG